jgi:hypothetical protein
MSEKQNQNLSSDDDVVAITSNKSEEVRDKQNINCWKWQCFEKVENKLKCKKCAKMFSSKSSISTLKYHYNSVHNIKGQVQIDSFINTTKLVPKQFNFIDVLIEFIVSGQHPFSIVEESGFINLINGLNDKVIPPSRDTIERRINDKFDEKKIVTQEFFKSFDGKVALTTDFWTSIKMKPFAAITAHFVCNESLKHVLVDFKLVPHPHDGEQFMACIKSAIDEFNLVGKIIAISIDNAKANVKGVKLLQSELEDNFYHIRCFGHIINLIVEAGVNEIKHQLESIRNLVSFITTSSKRRQMMEEACFSLKVENLTLIKNLPTRWNSTFNIVERVSKMKKVLNYLCHQEKSFEKYNISNEVWDLMKRICSFLKPFYDATLIISGQRYVSLCTVEIIGAYN